MRDRRPTRFSHTYEEDHSRSIETTFGQVNFSRRSCFLRLQRKQIAPKLPPLPYPTLPLTFKNEKGPCPRKIPLYQTAGVLIRCRSLCDCGSPSVPSFSNPSSFSPWVAANFRFSQIIHVDRVPVRAATIKHMAAQVQSPLR